MIKILKGNIIYTKTKDEFQVHEAHYLIAKDHLIVGIYKEIPEAYLGYLVEDYTGHLIIPSFIDLHIHGPQFMQMGIGLNLELIDWLDTYTFMLESRFSDVNYAKKVYPHFVEALYQEGSLRACIYGTIHDEANHVLADCLKEKKLSAYLGKVNMDRFSTVSLVQTAERSLRETKTFIEAYKSDDLIRPIITPRFAPSCSEELLIGLGNISKDFDVPVQSHLAENPSEIEWVKSLFPDAASYTDVYNRYGLLKSGKTLMAHGIYLSDSEKMILKEKGVYLVHCPNSNLNLASGIMPVTEYLDEGLIVGLGSDVGAGHQLGMQHTITAAIQCSKIRRLMNPKERPLSEAEAFYMATKVNGSFFSKFGQIGSFEEGYLLDALVIKDPHPLMDTLSPLEQLERFLYCGGPDSIHYRYLNGHLI